MAVLPHLLKRRRQRQIGAQSGPSLSRRGLLIGGAIGGGLLLGYALWPSAVVPPVPLAENERSFGLWLKIATNGSIVLSMPQSEMGQGVITELAEILAGELGADWRTIAVQPVGPEAGFANALLASQWFAELNQTDVLTAPLAEPASDADAPVADGDAAEWAADNAFVVTGGSTSVQMFEAPLRQAAAAARAMLCMAAARQWSASWEALDTAKGFVIHPDDKAKRLAFADLADAAAKETPPDPVPLRARQTDPLHGRDVARLDTPAKLDGSANFAADIRLPDMVYAAIAKGPMGSAAVAPDADLARSMNGVVEVVTGDDWIAVAASNWWAANQALLALKPKFKQAGKAVTDASIAEALAAALRKGPGFTVAEWGDVTAQMAEQTTRVFTAQAYAHAAPHAAPEPRSATVRIKDGRAEVWLASQAAGDARARVAAALGFELADVTLYPMLAGGSFGRNYENDIAVEAALIAKKLNRPVQVTRSREQDLRASHFRAPAQGFVRAAVDVQGSLTALSIKIASPPVLPDVMARLSDHATRADAAEQAKGQVDRNAVMGAHSPYAVPHFHLSHFPADVGIPVGRWRGNEGVVGTFLLEMMVDEVARATGAEPLSFRRPLLTKHPRLMRCLSEVSRMAGWTGGVKDEASGRGQGLACALFRGGAIAVVAEVEPDGEAIRVRRLSAMVDAGRIIHPDVARQQVEGGMLFAAAAALSGDVNFAAGLPKQKRLGQLGLMTLSDAPEVTVEFIRSDAPPAGIEGLSIPAVAPAIGNAVFSATGQRRWKLPLR